MSASAPTCCAPPKTTRRAVPLVAKSSLPSVLLVLLPKCPACIAAYAAAWSGFTLSITTASQLRVVLVAICVSSLSYLAWREAKHWLHHGPTIERRPER